MDVVEELKFLVKIPKNFGGGVGGGGGGGGGGRGGCRVRGGFGSGGLGRVGGGGVRVDVVEELKFLGKFTKKKFGGGVGGGGGQVCGGWSGLM